MKVVSLAYIQASSSCKILQTLQPLMQHADLCMISRYDVRGCEFVACVGAVEFHFWRCRCPNVRFICGRLDADLCIVCSIHSHYNLKLD